MLERLEQFCVVRGRTLLELAFSWLLTRPTVACVIASATQPEQIAGDIAATGWKLGPEDMAEIDTITAPVRPLQAP